MKLTLKRKPLLVSLFLMGLMGMSFFPPVSLSIQGTIGLVILIIAGLTAGFMLKKHYVDW